MGNNPSSIQVGQFYVFKNKYSGKYLSAWNDNTIVTTYKDKPELWEVFLIQEGIYPNEFSLRCYNGNYVSAWKDGKVIQQPHIKQWESFHIILHTDSSITLRTNHNTTICANYDVNQIPNDRYIGQSECHFIPYITQMPIGFIVDYGKITGLFGIEVDEDNTLQEKEERYKKVRY